MIRNFERQQDLEGITHVLTQLHAFCLSSLIL